MLTAEQLKARKIGGSSVATILGLNPYKSALEEYYELRGEVEPADLSDNEAVQAGNIMEAPIADLAALKLSKQWGREVKLRRSNVTIVHPKYDWLTVHIDRDVVGEERGVEIKNVGFRMGHLWGEQGTDEIPEYYLPQPHTYMLVKNYPVWSVAAYFGGADLRLYEVQRDPDMDLLIVERTHDFWHYHVLKGVPPEPDFESPRAVDIAKRLFPGTNGQTVAATADLEHWRAVYHDAVSRKGKYETAADCAKAHLLYTMGEAAILRFADGSEFTRKTTKRKAYSVEETSYVDARFKKAKADD